ncbi:MAG: hypothetical protein LBQ15_12255 [Clostridium sp.]|nr:hypothetical protein [Clostridium sp.]
MTKSLSSNLLKNGSAQWTPGERIIDANSRMAKRMEELAVAVSAEDEASPGGDGFRQGLAARDVSGLFSGSEDRVVVKAQEDLEKEERERKAAGEAMLAQARREADRLIEAARAQAQQIRREAEEQAQAQKKQVLDAARKQGYEGGQKTAMQELEKGRRELEQNRKELEEAYQKQVDTFEPRFIETITAIYEHIFHVDLTSYRGILENLIADTMRRTEMSREFVIHVSKEDYPYVSMQRKQMQACVATGSSSVVIVEDELLGKNECLVETESGIFDCGVDTQLEELSKKLKLLSFEKNAKGSPS